MIQKIPLPFTLKVPVLALGADLKGAFCVAFGKTAHLAGGFGDLAEVDNFLRFRRAVRGRMASLRGRPKTVICDLHPRYISSTLAEELIRMRNGRDHLVRAQHHEAHVAACMTENGITDNVIGVAFDGTGYGTDGAVWGGEFFIVRNRTFRRSAHLAYAPMPGADAAIRQPWRMAVSYLARTFPGGLGAPHNGFARRIRSKGSFGAIRQIMDRRALSPLTSSAGRLFDAVSSMVASCDEAAHEAEAAIALERLALTGAKRDPYPLAISAENGMLIADWRPMMRGIARDLGREDPADIALRFHRTIAEMIRSVVIRLKRRYGISRVCLAGGVFQNSILTGMTKEALSGLGAVYTHRLASCGDGGIALGQVALAAMRR